VLSIILNLKISPSIRDKQQEFTLMTQRHHHFNFKNTHLRRNLWQQSEKTGKLLIDSHLSYGEEDKGAMQSRLLTSQSSVSAQGTIETERRTALTCLNLSVSRYLGTDIEITNRRRRPG